MADRRGVKQRKQAHGEAMDAKYGPSELVLSRDINAGAIVPIPGPKKFDGSSGYYDSQQGQTFGWPDGCGVACACLECRKLFKIEKDHPAMESEDVIECPDCGAMSVMDLKARPYDNMGWDRKPDGRMEITVPYVRTLYASQPQSDSDPVRAKDTMIYRTVSVGKPVVRENGSVLLDTVFDRRMDSITYDTDKRAITLTKTMSDGSPLKGDDGKPIGPKQSEVFAVPRDNEKSIVRRESSGGMLHHEVHDTSMRQDKFEALNKEFTSALYGQVAKQLGLPPSRSEIDYGRVPEGTPSKIMTEQQQKQMIAMRFQYPALTAHELGRLNTNLGYAKEPVSQEDAAEKRFQTLTGTMGRLTAADGRLAHDLHMCKTHDDIEAKFRTVIYGDASQPQGQHIRLDMRLPDAEDRSIHGKAFKKMANTDWLAGQEAMEVKAVQEGRTLTDSDKEKVFGGQLATASNMRLALNLGIKDPNYVRQLFERGREGDYPYGILPNNETQATQRFAKVFIQHKDMGAAIKDLYPENGDRRIFSDAADMYTDVMKKAKVALYAEDIPEARYQATARQMHRYFSDPEHSVDTALREASFQRAWGDKAPECIEHFYRQYQQSPDVEPPQMLVARDGKALMDSGRTVKEIHDELSLMSNSLNSSEVYREYRYSGAELAALNHATDNLKFHLCRSNGECYEEGQHLNLCIGHYESKWDPSNDGGSYLVMVEDKTGGMLGCIEVTRQRDMENGGYKPGQLTQIKAANNHVFPGYQDDIMEYMRHAGLVSDDGTPKFSADGKKDFDQIGKDIYRYGHGDFALHRAAPRRDEQEILCRASDIPYHMEYVAKQAAEAERLRALNEAKRGPQLKGPEALREAEETYRRVQAASFNQTPQAQAGA